MRALARLAVVAVASRLVRILGVELVGHGVEDWPTELRRLDVHSVLQLRQLEHRADASPRVVRARAGRVHVPEPRRKASRNSRIGAPMSRASKSLAPALSEVDKQYFDSYSSWHIHEEMIRDRVRTDAYADAITSNGHLFKDKVVLDIGCGTGAPPRRSDGPCVPIAFGRHRTVELRVSVMPFSRALQSGAGILSMFAARAGAARVIGIDCSDIILTARKVVSANGYDGIITLLRGRVEDIEELPDDISSVDIIISEWSTPRCRRDDAEIWPRPGAAWP